MRLFRVMLAVDRGPRSTGRKMTVTVPADNRLSAAIQAERLGDSRVSDPDTEYTHTVNVREIPGPRPVRHMAAAMAA